MRSIRAQLVLLLVAGTLVLTCAAGVGLYSYMDEVLERSLDAALAAKSEAIISAVHMEDDGKPHLRQDQQFSSPVNRHEGPFIFQIWRDDGTTIAKAVLPSVTDLPHVTRPHKHFQDTKLSDGTSARITQISFLAHADEDEFDPPHESFKFTPAHLTLVVAHDRRSIDGPLAILLTGLVLAAVLIAIGILILVTWGVRRGLRPLAQVSELADRIGPDTLDVRFPSRENLPTELQPIGQKLNELLDRLTAAFARERRFSAAVAHELRTPLAELRSACDVALAWPDDSEGLVTAVAESRDIAVQMSNLVQTLLSLARQNTGIGPSIDIQTVNLSQMITGLLTALNSKREDHQIVVHQDLNESGTVKTNPEILRIVLKNLLENAMDYTPREGQIAIKADRSPAGDCLLRISNTCVDLKSQDLSRLFEPFWRADASRTGSSHVGLGLTLVQAFCQAINTQINVALISPETVEFTLRFPTHGC